MGTMGAASSLLAIVMTAALADRVTLQEQARLSEATRATVEMKAEGDVQAGHSP